MTTISTGLSTDVAACFASMQGRAYLCNDFDTMKVWNPPSSALDSAGIAAPSAVIGAPAAAGGNCSDGNHLFRYRYKNSKTGYYSNPSDALLVAVAGGNGALTFTITAGGGGGDLIRSTDSKVDTLVLEATPVNSPDYYIIGTTLQTAATIVASMADTSLIQQTNVQAAISEDGYGHEPPPLCAVIVTHKGRLFGLGTTTRSRTSVTMTNASTTVTGTNFSISWVGRIVTIGTETTAYEIASVTNSTTMDLTVAYGGATAATKSIKIVSKTPNRIFWTLALYPEAWRAAERSRDCMQDQADEVRGAMSYQGDLYICGRATTERLIYNTDPGVLEGVFISVPGTRGTFNQNTLVLADGVLYSMDRMGMFSLIGGTPQHISLDIDPTLLSLVDYSYYADFHAGYDPQDRSLLFFFVRSGDTACKLAARYDLDDRQWSLISFRQAITASKTVSDSNGRVRLMLGDENGYTWFYGVDGSYDGTPPISPTVVTTSGTPTVTSVTVAGATLPTGTQTLAGVVAYNPANGETAVVTSNTSDVMTMLSPGFTTAPASGVEIWLGSIPVELRSKWWQGPGAFEKKRPILRLTVFPGTATGKVRIYIYQDFATNPADVGTSTNAMPDGVVPRGTYFDIDLDGGNGDGYVDIPMLADWGRYWQWRAVSDRPDGALRILAIEFLSPPTAKAPQTPSLMAPVNE